VLEGCGGSSAPVGLAVINGHGRVITVDAAEPIYGHSTACSPTLGCNGLQVVERTRQDQVRDSL
jgi:hypothetical protein